MPGGCLSSVRGATAINPQAEEHLTNQGVNRVAFEVGLSSAASVVGRIAGLSDKKIKYRGTAEVPGAPGPLPSKPPTDGRTRPRP
jgi:hypothetical protein